MPEAMQPEDMTRDELRAYVLTLSNEVSELKDQIDNLERGRLTLSVHCSEAESYIKTLWHNNLLPKMPNALRDRLKAQLTKK